MNPELSTFIRSIPLDGASLAWLLLSSFLVAVTCYALWSRHRLLRQLRALPQQSTPSHFHRPQALEILEHTTDAFFQTDRSFVIQYANDKAAEILSLVRTDLIGATLWDLFPEAVSSTFFYQFRESQQSQAPAEFETWFAPKEVWFAVHAYPTDSTFSLYFRDITDRKRAEAALKESENRYRALFDSLGDGAFVYRDNTLLDANWAACQNLGYSRDRMLRLELSDIDSLLSGPEADFMLRQLHRTGSASFETEHIRIDGSRMPVWVNARQIDYQGEPAILAIARDMTERRNQDKQLEQMATTDPLTSAYNRRHFMEQARRMIRDIRRRGGAHFTILMLDLDHFKQVNDTFGHDFGDRALVHFSHICRQRLRGPDLFCRLGGEEFAAILPETTTEKATLVAERLRESLAEKPLKADGGTAATLTVSIGLADSRSLDELSHNRLLLLADRALYAAKHNGRNQVQQYQPEMTQTEASKAQQDAAPCS